MAKHIGVIGNPASGKSIFSAALAKELSKRGKRTILISGDCMIPMQPFFCGNSGITGLGTLCNGEITAQTVASAVRVLKKYPDIGVIGVQLGENTATITGRKLFEIKDVLDEMVDCVIWDGTSDLSTDFNQMILQHTKDQVCILTVDTKGILYYEQNWEVLSRKMLLGGAVRPYSPYSEMSVRVGGFFGKLPFSREIERLMLEGDIFSIDQVWHDKYRLAVEAVVERMYEKKEEKIDFWDKS